MTITDPGEPPAPPPASPVERLIASLTAELRARIATPAEDKEHTLGPGFVPEDPALDLAACLRLGIPPRPQDPAALALWRQMVEQPLTLRPFMAADVNLGSDIVHSSFRSAGGDSMDEGQEEAGAVFTGGGRLSSSGNWSGGAIIPHSGERFVQVLATWRVPTVRAGDGVGPWVCSTWIGLDGLRRWMGSMPQMGTTQSLGQVEASSTLPANFPWFQWWLRGRGIQLPVPINLSVTPGKLVYCAVTRLPPNQPAPGDENQVQFFFRHGAQASYLVCKPPPSDAPSAKVASRGASAQWILERPTALKDTPNGNVKKDDLFPLPDFDTAGVEAFAASMALTPDGTGIVNSDTVAAPALTPARPLRTPRLLRMVRVLSDPPRTEVIAKPNLAPDGKLTVRYRGPL